MAPLPDPPTEHDEMACRACGRPARASEGYPCETCGTFICLLCDLAGVTRCARCDGRSVDEPTVRDPERG